LDLAFDFNPFFGTGLLAVPIPVLTVLGPAGFELPAESGVAARTLRSLS